MSMIDCKGMIVSLLERIDSVREEKVSAGTKYRLMGLVADVAEVAQALQEKVMGLVADVAEVAQALQEKGIIAQNRKCELTLYFSVSLDSKGRKWQRIKLSNITQLLN